MVLILAQLTQHKKKSIKFLPGCQTKTNAPQNGAFLPLLQKMAGDESLNWHPLLSDFTAVGEKLEQLGFTYYKGQVTIIDPMEVQ